jgi:2,4-dienoyl-CoA reductase-like NADH-dependent reductase (Old Yellow Enzyme family)
MPLGRIGNYASFKIKYGLTSTFAVELVHAYSNLSRQGDHLRRLRQAAAHSRPVGESTQPRQNQRRLNEAEVRELIQEYEQGATVKALAQRFGNPSSYRYRPTPSTPS